MYIRRKGKEERKLEDKAKERRENGGRKGGVEYKTGGVEDKIGGVEDKKREGEYKMGWSGG